jgi:hypothetical protein
MTRFPIINSRSARMSAPWTGACATRATASVGDHVVVGVLDNSVDLRHTSFRDDGMQPPPATQQQAGRRAVADPRGARHADILHGCGAPSSRTSSCSGPTSTRPLGWPRAHLAYSEVCFKDACPSTLQIVAIERGVFEDGVDGVSI